MGGIYTKIHKNAGPKRAQNFIPERHNYRVVQKRNKRLPEPLNEVDSIQSTYNRLTHVDKLSKRASTPCLSFNRTELKQLYDPLKRDEIIGRVSPLNIPPSSSSNWEEKVNSPRRPNESTGNVRHSSFSASDYKTSRVSINTCELKSSTKPSDGVTKLVHFEGKTFDFFPASTSEEHEGSSKGDDSVDARVASIAQVKPKPQMNTMTCTLSSTNSPSPLPKAVQYEPPFRGMMADRSTGDVINLPEVETPTKAKFPKQAVKPCLAEKPPTPPLKQFPMKQTRANEQSPQPRFRSVSRGRFVDRSKKLSTLRHTPSPPVQNRYSSPRSSSLPKPSEGDRYVRASSLSPRPQSPLRHKRSSSASRHSVTEAISDRSQCLSRIEYTFYINDTETYQRPFYDKRVEAIARSTNCNVCLHKPPPGHKPVFYKGMRVLPVTISARTMVSLKRCISRLDMQYPYFNVKAFCPPDMY